MVQVGRFLKGERGSLFVSDEVFNFIKSFEYQDKNGIIINKVIKKLKYFADGGFVIDKINIRFEGSGVYRIEIENSGRIIGFYDNKDFIAIRSFFKKTQHLTRIQRDIVAAVKKIFINHDWVIAINK
jgi:hypothetical protein